MRLLPVLKRLDAHAEQLRELALRQHRFLANRLDPGRRIAELPRRLALGTRDRAGLLQAFRQLVKKSCVQLLKLLRYPSAAQWPDSVSKKTSEI